MQALEGAESPSGGNSVLSHIGLKKWWEGACFFSAGFLYAP